MGWAPDPPATPDYAGAAKEQGQANLDATRAGARLNNPNVISPYGTQTTTWGTTFDQAGYDEALTNYNAEKSKVDSAWSQWNAGGRNGAFDLKAPTAINRSDFELDTPTVRQTLSPDQQRIFDKGNQVKLGMTDLAQQGTNALKGVVGTGVNFDGAPQLSNTDFTANAPGLRSTEFNQGVSAMPGSSSETRQKVFDAMMGRVNEDTANTREQTNSGLLAAGIAPGSKAYDDKMNLVNRQYNDARQQAILGSGEEAARDFGMDLSRRQQGVGENAQMFDASGRAREMATREAGQEFGATSEARRQSIAEYLSQRQTPLNEISALMSGSQVSNPFSMPGYSQNNQVQAAPLFAAQNAAADYNTDLYNAKAAQSANQMQGLFQLGSAGIMGGAMMSDRRLKSNIVRLGDHHLGIGWYAYDIFGRREQGVMAQELRRVKPEAVITLPNGYLAVRYDLIGGRHAVRPE